MVDSVVLRHEMAGAVTAATHLSLHTADPTGTGANEASGGTPAYARVAITAWSSDTDSLGVPDDSGLYIATPAGPFDVPAGTYTHVGLWAGSVYYDSAAITPTTAAAQDTVTLDLVAFWVRPEETV